MKKRFLSVILALVITICCVPCWAVEANWDGPLGEHPLPTLCDTGRGYIVYYWYDPAIYYSPDGVTWTELSDDLLWVKEASPYIYAGVRGLGHREFEFLWTGSEYMMRQSLRDDPRSTHALLGDSPRNSLVTFLDEDFQVIGEQAFDGPVTGIRYEDGVYYATSGGVETAFSRVDWAQEAPPAADTGFSDVQAGDWFAPYVAVCAEEGLMQGTGEGKFEPERELTLMETVVLMARLYAKNQGLTAIPHFEMPEDPNDMFLLYDAQGNRVGNLEDIAGTDIEQFLSVRDKWYWDAFLYLGLSTELFLEGTGHDNIPEEANFSYLEREPCLRGDLAELLEQLLPKETLTALSPAQPPDTDAEWAVTLYQAGIFTGVDSQGNFNSTGHLTRAEAAAVLARALRPELRIGAVSEKTETK